MLVHTDVSTLDAVARPVAFANERGIEVRALLRAVTALRRDGILTVAEYEAKRQRLSAQL